MVRRGSAGTGGGSSGFLLGEDSSLSPSVAKGRTAIDVTDYRLAASCLSLYGDRSGCSYLFTRTFWLLLHVFGDRSVVACNALRQVWQLLPVHDKKKKKKKKRTLWISAGMIL